MMQRLYLIVVLTVLSGVVTYAQEDEVMSVLGVNSPEEADPEEFERMSDLLVHPLRINLVSESRLIASGLLTRYQAASLIDYRRRHGNIMSYTELAALDGFNDEVVSRLRPFLSLECYSLHDPEKHIQNDVALKAAVRNDAFIAAICAAPFVLGKRGLLEGKRATCYPGFESELTGAVIAPEKVVRDGKVITAAGMGVAVDFGLALVAALRGEAAAADIRSAIQCKD